MNAGLACRTRLSTAGRAIGGWRLALVCVAALGSAATALADAIYSASLTGAMAITGSPVPVTLTSNFDPKPGAHIEGSALATSPLGARIETVDPPEGQASFSTQGSADAVALYRDIVITGPGSSVTGTLHLPFEAGLNLARFGSGQATAHVDLNAVLFGLTTSEARIVVNYDPQISLLNVGVTGSVDPTGTDGVALDPDGYLRQIFKTETLIQGPIAGIDFDENDRLQGEMLLTGPLPVNRPFTLELEMNLTSTTHGEVLQSLSDVDASDTFGVPQGGLSVFGLPDGFTVNSPSLGIVDNVVPAPAGTTVTEPPTVSLVGLGMLVLGLLGRRGRGRGRSGSEPTVLRPRYRSARPVSVCAERAGICAAVA